MLTVFTMHSQSDALSLSYLKAFESKLDLPKRAHDTEMPRTHHLKDATKENNGINEGKLTLIEQQRAQQEKLERDALAELLKESKPQRVKGEDDTTSKPQKQKKNVDAPKYESTPSAPTKRLKPWQLRQLEEDKEEFAMRELEKDWIRVLPTPKKTELKQDREVLMRGEYIEPLQRPNGEASGIVGQPRAYTAAQNVLRQHPLFDVLRDSDKYRGAGGNDAFDETNCAYGTVCAIMLQLSQTPQCVNSPLYLTMASVGDDLYWQLIENFVYTAVKFDFVQCALVICVSDDYCMKLCKESLFPCYDYRRPVPSVEQQEKYHLSVKPSVMESIAELKLFHIPQALLKGVNTFMLDLDVGFLNDPRHMIQPFFEVPTIDIFVQLDYLFIMNRTKAGWKQWFTEPLPNIGLFLCRGNNKTHAVFSHAWKKYQKMIDPRVREQPGKDQNHVLDGIRVGRGTFGLRFAYFSNSTAALMDKIVQKWRGIELGGKPAADLFKREHTLAIHTTCYEQSTKVMGLKATNAFWNPLYYDPLRPTITKQILYETEDQARDEVRSMVWLAMATGRAFVSPNLIGSDELVPTSPTHEGMAMWPGFRVAYLKRIRKATKAASTSSSISGMAFDIFDFNSATSGGDKTQPLLKQNALSVQILEPAFYWRVQRDYDDVPEPYILLFDEHASLSDLRDQILKLPHETRIVVQHRVSENKRREKHMSSSLMIKETEGDERKRISKWAKDSVGTLEGSYATEMQRYGNIPSVKNIRSETGVNDVLQGMRTCNDVFQKLRGNRTCFQVCD